MSIDFTNIQKTEPDSLVNYLTKLFYEARFDDIQEDGTMWCSDSNASVDPHQIAKDIRELLQVK